MFYFSFRENSTQRQFPSNPNVCRFLPMLLYTYPDGGDYECLVLEALHDLRVGLGEVPGEVDPVLHAPGSHLSLFALLAIEDGSFIEICVS